MTLSNICHNHMNRRSYLYYNIKLLLFNIYTSLPLIGFRDLLYALLADLFPIEKPKVTVKNSPENPQKM